VSGVTEVRVTRSRDALEGQILPVTGRLRRHGRLELLVVLPDGTGRLIPQAWTGDGGGDGTGRARRARRSGRSAICWPRACWLPRFGLAPQAPGSRLHESHRARRTTVQPAQLSLLPEQVPAPAPMVFAELPSQEMTTRSGCWPG
jgi:hypothetical protein